MTDARLRSSPLTIGVLIFGLLAAGGVAAYALRAQERLDAAAATAVQRHRDTDVDRAHPDLQLRYPTRMEHSKDVGEMKSDIRSIKEAVERIEAQLSAPRGRGR